MRFNDKDRLKTVSRQIRIAKTSLEKLEGSELTQTIQTESADIIPLGQFPDEPAGDPENN